MYIFTQNYNLGYKKLYPIKMVMAAVVVVVILRDGNSDDTTALPWRFE